MRAIFTYHSIDTTGSVISLAPAQFRRHLAWLVANEVQVCRLPELFSEHEHNQHVVALTFDDGFANFATFAAPLLRDYGFPSTLFVVPGRVGLTNRWSAQQADDIPTLPLLDWDALGLIAESGVEIGAHTYSHARLPTLSIAEAEDDVMKGNAALSTHLGMTPRSFAYPYGAVTDAVAAMVSRHCSFACTTDFRAMSREDEPSRLPRLDSYYFRDQRQLLPWNSMRFRARLRVRGGLRRLRGARP